MTPRQRKKLEPLLVSTYAEVQRLHAEGRHEEAEQEYLYYRELVARWHSKPSIEIWWATVLVWTAAAVSLVVIICYLLSMSGVLV